MLTMSKLTKSIIWRNRRCLGWRNWLIVEIDKNVVVDETDYLTKSTFLRFRNWRCRSWRNGLSNEIDIWRCRNRPFQDFETNIINYLKRYRHQSWNRQLTIEKNRRIGKISEKILSKWTFVYFLYLSPFSFHEKYHFSTYLQL